MDAAYHRVDGEADWAPPSTVRRQQTAHVTI